MYIYWLDKNCKKMFRRESKFRSLGPIRMETKKEHAIRCGGFNKNWNILLVSTILICLKLPNLKLKILTFANLAINQEDS